MKIKKEKALRKNQIVTQWVYCFVDDNGKKHKRICKNCNTKEEAIAFVKKLSYLNQEQYLIKNIAADMYLPESDHMKRRKSFGKNICESSRQQRRQHIELIIKNFGNYSLKDLQVRDIEMYLINDQKHSGSWKNFYLETFSSIYEETIWKCASPIPKPRFQRFARNSRKADVFSTNELNLIFDPELWSDNSVEYLLFFITASCGLRLGEACGLRVNQFNFQDKFLIVNGFVQKNGFRTDYNKKATVDDKKYRVVPLPDETINRVLRYIARKKLQLNDYLFLTEDGNFYRQDHLRWYFSKALRTLDINCDNSRKLVPHSLRFTYVTRMRRTCTVDEVRKIVGHNSNEMTDYYTRPNLLELKESIKNTIDEANKLFIE